MSPQELAEYIRKWFPIHQEQTAAKKERYGKVHEAADMLEKLDKQIKNQEE